MFTGLIEDLGTLRDIRTGADQAILTVGTALPVTEFTLGESIAINGVCLTVTRFAEGTFSADVSPETLDCTTLGRLSAGAKVNLERALRLSDRLGGHLVTGHVDGLARIVELRQDGNAWRFSFQGGAFAERFALHCLQGGDDSGRSDSCRQRRLQMDIL